MGIERIKSGVGALGRLRVRGAGPDPAFRADLRERLMAAAAAGHGDVRGSARGRGAAKPVD
jgi:hypothetical protein